MPDVPEQAVWLAADALCALHDLDPIWARTLAAAALQAAVPAIAEAWGALECTPLRDHLTADHAVMVQLGRVAKAKFGPMRPAVNQVNDPS